VTCPETRFPDGTHCGEFDWHARDCPEWRERPMTPDRAAMFVAHEAWPNESYVYQVGWYPRLIDEPDLARDTINQARLRIADRLRWLEKAAEVLGIDEDPVNPYLPEAPADGQHIFGEDGRSYRCSRCGAYQREDSEDFHKPCRGGWACSGKFRYAAEERWKRERAEGRVT